MIKGRAIIELTDVNTGEKTVQVEDNIMTDALYHYFNPPLAYLGLRSIRPSSSGINQQFAYSESNLSWATSGLVVSNQEQPESADTLEIPLGTIIGAAAKQYKVQTDADNRYGEYNETESFIDTENGIFNHVFDFPTSACNGTVRCLSIMHPGGVIGLPYATYDTFKENLDMVYRRKYFVGAEIPIFSEVKNVKLYHPCPGFSTLDSHFDTAEGTKIGHWAYRNSDVETQHSAYLDKLSTLEKVLAYDVDKSCVYTMQWTDINKFRIRCRASNINAINVVTNFKLLKDYPEIEVTTQTTSMSNGIACIDKVTQKFYYITTYNNNVGVVSPGDNMTAFSVDLVSGETSIFTIPNTTGTSLYLTLVTRSTSSGSSTYSGYRKNSGIVHNGNLYLCQSTQITGKNAATSYKWFKIPLSNPLNVTECRTVAGFTPLSESATMPREIQLIDDKYLGIDNGTTSLLLNIENDTIYNDYSTDYTISTYGPYTTSIPLIGSKFTMFVYSSGSYYESSPHTQYVTLLARLDMPMTVNNLSTPIHKTPSQTMKITYVLKELEPEEDEIVEGGE
jgi:hypothetical protein